MAPRLATKWQESPDGLTYNFELRQGVKFHNGEPFTGEDVKFSFERDKGTSAGDLTCNREGTLGVTVFAGKASPWRFLYPEIKPGTWGFSGA